jgi:hypothetical protein
MWREERSRLYEVDTTQNRSGIEDLQAMGEEFEGEMVYTPYVLVQVCGSD